jgi:hypothetical protein
MADLARRVTHCATRGIVEVPFRPDVVVEEV